MNPESNIALASVLVRPLRGAPEEASFRAACGRAYYAAFAVARDLLVSARFHLEGDGSVHGEVIRLLRKSASREVKKAAATLDLLRVTRNSADYDVGLKSPGPVEFNRHQSQLIVVAADTFVHTVKKASASDPRLGIPDWIR